MADRLKAIGAAAAEVAKVIYFPPRNEYTVKALEGKVRIILLKFDLGPFSAYADTKKRFQRHLIHFIKKFRKGRRADGKEEGTATEIN